MALGNNGKITGDGGLGGLLKVASPIINNVLKKNSTDTDYVPASSHADLKASDVKSAKAIVSADGKYTDYIIYVKDQTDGPTATPTTAVLLLAASEPSAASMRLSTSSAQSSRAAKKMLSSPTPTLTSSLA